ncbi:MAG TPA: ribose-phosphate pyrophosphokinase [Longimicrobiales bacterium]|nr:ribose-phosphate pyrophosphokinase [Longimicrobiales bacterium]
MAETTSNAPLLLIAGTANRALAEEVAQRIEIPLADVTAKRFADGEIFVRINENARGRDAYIIQPTPPPAENLMELLLMVDAARRASAARVTVVMPYYGYSRQDRKDQPRVAIGAKLVADLIQAAGADRVLGIDFHTHQIQGFFDIPVDHLYAAPVLTSYFRDKNLEAPVVVAPDVGAAKMARGFARRIDASFAIIDKRRPAHNIAEVLTVVGEVAGRTCVIVDDMIDTAGTLESVIHALLDRGARAVYAAATHALLSGPAVERLQRSPVAEVVVTDTLFVPPEKRFPKLTTLSVGPLLARAIWFTHSNESVSQLFD